jgi:hypothetical protein
VCWQETFAPIAVEAVPQYSIAADPRPDVEISGTRAPQYSTSYSTRDSISYCPSSYGSISPTIIISLGRAAGGKRVRGGVKLGWSRLGRAAPGEAAGKGQGPGTFSASGVCRRLPMACTCTVRTTTSPAGRGRSCWLLKSPHWPQALFGAQRPLARTPLSHARRLRAGALPILGRLILQHDRRPCFASLVLRTVLYFKCWGLG